MIRYLLVNVKAPNFYTLTEKKRAGKATENFPARFFASDFASFLFRIDAK